MSLLKILGQFKTGKSQMAVVIDSDDHITPVGILTLEDVIETLIGDKIYDEMDFKRAEAAKKKEEEAQTQLYIQSSIDGNTKHLHEILSHRTEDPKGGNIQFTISRSISTKKNVETEMSPLLKPARTGSPTPLRRPNAHNHPLSPYVQRVLPRFSIRGHTSKHEKTQDDNTENQKDKTDTNKGND